MKIIGVVCVLIILSFVLLFYKDKKEEELKNKEENELKKKYQKYFDDKIIHIQDLLDYPGLECIGVVLENNETVFLTKSLLERDKKLEELLK